MEPGCKGLVSFSDGVHEDSGALQRFQDEYVPAEHLDNLSHVAVYEASVFVHVAGEPHAHPNFQDQDACLCRWVADHSLVVVDLGSCVWELDTEAFQIDGFGTLVCDRQEGERLAGFSFDADGLLDCRR